MDLSSGGAGASFVCGVTLLTASRRVPRQRRDGRHAAPRLVSTELAAKIAEHEDRLNAQDEAWSLWRAVNGGAAAGLRMIRGGKEGA